MSICASGASQAKAGVSAAVVVDQAYVQSILPAGLDWLYPYLPFMHGLEIGDVGAFCALDPPTWSMPSAGQMFSFVTGGPIGEAQTVNQFIQDITRAFLWYRLCECTSGATPSPPSAPSPPVGLPAINPSDFVSLPSSAPCISAGFILHTVTNGSGSFNRGGVAFGSQTAPRRVRFTLTNTVTAGAGWTISSTPRWNNGATTLALPPVLAAPNTTETRDYEIPTSAVWTEFNVTTNATSGTGTIDETMTADVYCGTDTPPPTMPCCPPDPVLMARINQILELVTLVQRQAAPFGYVPGTVHSGLTGAGELTVSGLLGCKVDLTTTPARVGSRGTDPVHLFDIGWITFGSADGYPSQKRIDADPTLFFPARAGLFTTLAYDLTPGVVVTITELLKEP